MERDVEELKKKNADYTARLLASEEEHREVNIRLSMVEGEKVKADQDLVATKRELKEHDHHYLQLNEILESHKKLVSESE